MLSNELLHSHKNPPPSWPKKLFGRIFNNLVSIKNLLSSACVLSGC